MSIGVWIVLAVLVACCVVPPHRYDTDTVLIVGEDPRADRRAMRELSGPRMSRIATLRSITSLVKGGDPWKE